LAAILSMPGFFSIHDRYRYAEDAIFFLPLIYLAR
jgi:hypothetical protein